MVTVTEKILVPTLRFFEFKEPWEAHKVSQLISRLVDPVAVEPLEEYREIGIRSHGKGLFHKQKVEGSALGNKRVFWVKPNCFIVNIVFAWEQAIAKTTDGELGFIASHRFPMYEPLNKKANVDFLVFFFQRKRGKNILELASPGGAGRNKTLGQKEFEKTKLIVPKVVEQNKIATFLISVDTKIQQLKRKHTLMQQYKKGVMQQLFSQQVRFKDDEGRDYPDWKTLPLSSLLYEHKKRNYDNKHSKADVLSVSGDFGVVNQIDHMGRSYAGELVDNYHVVLTGDLVYTKSPLKKNPYGIMKTNKGRKGIVSTLYAVYSCKNQANPDYLDHYFSIDDNVNKYLRPLVHKGAKNDMKINNQRVLIDPICYPSKAEQNKIADFLDKLDCKIWKMREQVTQAETFKKGLLQQMFV